MPFSFEDRDNRAAADPVGLLQEFFNQLNALLRDIIHGEVEGFTFRVDLGEDITLVQMVLDDCIERDVFARTSAALPAADLGNVGLSGPSLSGKLGVLEALSGQIQAGVRKALKYILELINSILSSLKIALGPLAFLVDSIAELKDLIKAKIEIVNDW
ncbi:MAG: hypothetical protein OIF47_01735 [Marinibacterium sp.]|nr:hypothetical protein [Marinibacterium sp.]